MEIRAKIWSQKKDEKKEKTRLTIIRLVVIYGQKMRLEMKKSPASIDRNATASAKQSTSENAQTAENIFHSKPTENQATKETAMNTPSQYRVTDCLTDMQGNDLDALITQATSKRWHGKLTIWRWNGLQWKYVRTYEF